MISAGEAAMSLGTVCERVLMLKKKVLLTPQLGSSPRELRNCWECNQFHL